MGITEGELSALTLRCLGEKWWLGCCLSSVLVTVVFRVIESHDMITWSVVSQALAFDKTIVGGMRGPCSGWLLPREPAGCRMTCS